MRQNRQRLENHKYSEQSKAPQQEPPGSVDLEVVRRGSEAQLQVGENLNKLAYQIRVKAPKYFHTNHGEPS